MTVTVLLLGLFVVAGLAAGHFINDLIARVPEDRSAVRPRWRCQSCGAAIAPRDRVPLLSWLMLRGRCRQCSARSGVSQPIVALVSGVLWGGLAWWCLVGSGPLPMLPLLLVLSSAALALVVIDVEHHRLPDAIVLPLYPVTAAGLALAGVLSGDWPWATAAVGLAVWVVVIGGIWLVSGGRGMGFGDVKLAPVLGVTLGWVSVASAVSGLVLAFMLGAVAGVALMVSGRLGRRSHLAFGPFLILGAGLGLAAGEAMGDWYVGLLATG